MWVDGASSAVPACTPGKWHTPFPSAAPAETEQAGAEHNPFLSFHFPPHSLQLFPPHFFCPEEGLMHTKYWFRLSIKTALMKGGVAPGLSAATGPPCQRMPSQSKRVGPAHGLLPSDTT